MTDQASPAVSPAAPDAAPKTRRDLDKDGLALLGVVVIVVGGLIYAGVTRESLGAVGLFISPVITGLFAVTRGVARP
jgi:uncharacterized membrane protein